jgi:rubrerythrin
VEIMELETRQFYECALEKISDASTRKLLGDLAELERPHSEFAAGCSFFKSFNQA